MSGFVLPFVVSVDMKDQIKNTIKINMTILRYNGKLLSNLIASVKNYGKASPIVFLYLSFRMRLLAKYLSEVFSNSPALAFLTLSVLLGFISKTLFELLFFIPK